MNASQAFIAYLRVEASSAEERAKKLRATAAAIEANAHEGKTQRVMYIGRLYSLSARQ
jgi:hypothetical protein